MLNNFECIFIKFDRNYRMVYTNRDFQQVFFGASNHDIFFEASEFLHINTPKCYWPFILSCIDSQGFFNGIINVDMNGFGGWVFADIGRRFSPDGNLQGYEMLLYPTTSAAKTYGENLFKSLCSVESGADNQKAVRLGLAAFQNMNDQLGCSYEEYVHELQAKP